MKLYYLAKTMIIYAVLLFNSEVLKIYTFLLITIFSSVKFISALVKLIFSPAKGGL